jgi:hypothetical protein
MHNWINRTHNTLPTWPTPTEPIMESLTMAFLQCNARPDGTNSSVDSSHLIGNLPYTPITMNDIPENRLPPTTNGCTQPLMSSGSLQLYYVTNAMHHIMEKQRINP